MAQGQVATRKVDGDVALVDALPQPVFPGIGGTFPADAAELRDREANTGGRGDAVTDEAAGTVGIGDVHTQAAHGPTRQRAPVSVVRPESVSVACDDVEGMSEVGHAMDTTKAKKLPLR